MKKQGSGDRGERKFSRGVGRSGDKSYSQEKSFGKKSYGSFDSGERRERGKSFGEKPYRKKHESSGEERSRDKKPFRESRGDGERRERKPFGEKPFRKSYSSDSGEGKSFRRRDDGEKPFRKKFDSDSGERRPFKGRGDGEKTFRKSYNSESGERKPFGERGDGEKNFRKSYNSDSGERKPYKRRGEEENGERKPFRKRSDSDFGERKSYRGKGEGNFSERPYRKKFDSDSGERKSYPRKKDGEEGGQRSYGERSYRKNFDSDKGERKSYRSREDGDRGDREFSSGERKYGREKSFQKKDHRKKFRDDVMKLEKKEENGPVRLNKYISNAGVCSRREADNLIKAGAVTVNGKVVTEMGFKINPGDVVNYGGGVIKSERKVYLLLNKPKDYITTMDDERGRRTVMELIKGATKERLYPVGRLDRNTTGLLLFTNDGDLTKKLTHPKYEVKKIYQVTLDKNLRGEDFQQIVEGMELEDGPIKVDDIQFAGDSKSRRELGIEIHSGRNRIVRRIFEKLGYEVIKLDRVFFAGLTKKDLPKGRWRLLDEKEVGWLKMLS